MKMSKIFMLTFGVFALTACSQTMQSADKHTHWGYTGHESPEHWATLSPKFAICTEGKSQSPVNIVNAIDGKLAPIKIDYHPSSVEIVNNGHTIQVDFKDANNLMQLNGHTYTLKQFHFHVPSENQIRGKSFPLEAHFVHADKDGNLAVLGVLYVLSSENQRLAPIWHNFPQKAGETHTLDTAFDPTKLIPKKRDYYRFSGSLTTPPCSEGVNWLVLKQYDNISQAQVDAFSTLMKGHNNRPIQPINARVIVE
ncbi:carbonic anhydrase [Pasteurella canis]|uniref:carbonic anhydrase n=1 Tax=Pasteurella canis TaxID=753 RepID=UPI001E415070|nr:carbonic anhydrase [Pasteurella canis]GJJ79755.1 carbonic anhydrase [Pasteurella canis]